MTVLGRHSLFTVIIPTFGRPDLLDEAISSVERQSLKDWEMIIVDDCSPKPVGPYPNPRISVVRNPSNLGKSFSINAALKRATGDIIVILDDDDAWGPRRLENARKAHQLAPVAVCGGTTMGAVTTNSAAVTFSVEPWTWRTHIASGGALSVARSVFPEFDANLRGAEDIEWTMRLRRQAPQIAIINSTDFQWRVHTGYRHLNGLSARIDGRLRVLEKHQEYLAAHRSEKAMHLRQLGYLYLRSERRGVAFRWSVRSLLTWPSMGAIRLGVRALLPMKATRAPLKAILRWFVGGSATPLIAKVRGQS